MRFLQSLRVTYAYLQIFKLPFTVVSIHAKCKHGRNIDVNATFKLLNFHIGLGSLFFITSQLLFRVEYHFEKQNVSNTERSY